MVKIIWAHSFILDLPPTGLAGSFAMHGLPRGSKLLNDWLVVPMRSRKDRLVQASFTVVEHADRSLDDWWVGHRVVRWLLTASTWAPARQSLTNFNRRQLLLLLLLLGNCLGYFNDPLFARWLVSRGIFGYLHNILVYLLPGRHFKIHVLNECSIFYINWFICSSFAFFSFASVFLLLTFSCFKSLISAKVRPSGRCRSASH